MIQYMEDCEEEEQINTRMEINEAGKDDGWQWRRKLFRIGGGACPPTPVSPPLDDGKDCRAQFVQLENTAIECLCADKDEEERWR